MLMCLLTKENKIELRRNKKNFVKLLSKSESVDLNHRYQCQIYY